MSRSMCDGKGNFLNHYWLDSADFLSTKATKYLFDSQISLTQITNNDDKRYIDIRYLNRECSWVFENGREEREKWSCESLKFCHSSWSEWISEFLSSAPLSYPLNYGCYGFLVFTTSSTSWYVEKWSSLLKIYSFFQKHQVERFDGRTLIICCLARTHKSVQ